MNETQRRRAARERLWRDAFRGIELEGKTVLDAGTGEGFFTRFLAEHRPGRLVSVTCLAEELPKARQTLGPYADAVTFVRADLTQLDGMADASFDVVGADFLIAAVSAYSPYRECECLRELVRVLRPGGRIVVTGWEVWPENRSPAERSLRRLFQLREVVHRLTESASFREHPAFWVEARLRELGLPPERTASLPDRHHDLTWFFRQVRSGLAELEEDLARPLGDRLEQIERELAAQVDWRLGLEFGRLYAVIACKLGGAVLLGSPPDDSG